MAEATLRDVPKLAGVHAGTASRAMDPERSALVTAATRERVLRAVAEIGYRGNAMARGLRTGRSGIIAVVAADFGNPFLPPMLRGVEDEINPAGFILLVAETHDRPGQLKKITDHLAARRVDAIILGAAHYDDEPVVENLGRTIPVVLAARNLPAKRHDSVVHDDVLGSRLATLHLTDFGHTKLAIARADVCRPSSAGLPGSAR
jgi:LacI family transcriptional regulator